MCRAGEAILDVVARHSTLRWSALYEAAAAVASTVDDEFRRHCRVSLWQGRTLTISVDEASMVSMIRSRWLKVLCDLAHAQALDQRVVFRFGREGLSLARHARRAEQGSPRVTDRLVDAGQRRMGGARP